MVENGRSAPDDNTKITDPDARKLITELFDLSPIISVADELQRDMKSATPTGLIKIREMLEKTQKRAYDAIELLPHSVDGRQPATRITDKIKNAGQLAVYEKMQTGKLTMDELLAEFPDKPKHYVGNALRGLKAKGIVRSGVNYGDSWELLPLSKEEVITPKGLRPSRRRDVYIQILMGKTTPAELAEYFGISAKDAADIASILKSRGYITSPKTGHYRANLYTSDELDNQHEPEDSENGTVQPSPPESSENVPESTNNDVPDGGTTSEKLSPRMLQVYTEVRKNPGTHMDIAKRLEMTGGNASYHLSTLKNKFGLLELADGVYSAKPLESAEVA